VWHWDEKAASLEYCIDNNAGSSYQFRIAQFSEGGGDFFRVLKNDDILISLPAIYRMVFVLSGDTLIYAIPNTKGGATVVAFDLKQKVRLWESVLQGVPSELKTSKNRLILELANNAIKICEDTGFARFVEFLSLTTGASVGKKVFP